MDRRKPLEGFPGPFYWHVEIEQSNVDVLFQELFYRFTSVFRDNNLVALGSEH